MKIFPVFIPHLGCPFQCIYCNQKAITRSSLPNLEILQKEIAVFCENNPKTKKQIAFFGGTFTLLYKEFQQKLFDCVKPFSQELAGIRISTRPDAINSDILDFLRKNGVKTIELGIQSFSDKVLKAAKRGYDSETALKNATLIRTCNFELGIQLMPGLPEFSDTSLAETIKQTIQAKPDLIRIYPTIVLKNTILADKYENGDFTPLTLEKAIEITAKMISSFKRIRIAKIGLHSDIASEEIIAGPYHQTFGELVQAELLFQKINKKFVNKTLHISKYDVSLFKGFNCNLIKKLKSQNKLFELPVIIDDNLKKHSFSFTDKEPEQIW